MFTLKKLCQFTISSLVLAYNVLIGSEIKNRYFVVDTCFESQPRWRQLQTVIANDQFIGSISLSHAMRPGLQSAIFWVTKLLN